MWYNIQHMEKVATDIYTFSRLREEGFTYVDKTDALYAMASGETGVQFFIDRPAAEAMEQIKGKDYAGKYALSGKRITLVGISFSAEKRTIVEELVEEIP